MDFRAQGPLDTASEARTELEKGWGSRYHGSTHKILLNNLNGMAKRFEPGSYANNVSIIQSSGTGKSRTMHEMAQLVFTIPINVRPASEDNNCTFSAPAETFF